jgi:D-amino-acid dehydrogenase
LSEGTGAEKWIVPGDYVFGYGSRADYEAEAFTWKIRREHGFEPQEIEDFKAYDPVFSEKIGFGIKMPNHGRITSPGDYVKDLARHAEANGTQMIKADVRGILRENGQVTGLRTTGETIACDTVILATGVWSKPMADMLGLNVPLESERGYHIELWEPNFMPRGPVMIASGKFVATPMEGRLRLAGVVELGGLKAPPSRAPFDLLKRQALAAMPGLTWARETEWMGHRPAPSDSIPVIGEVPGIKGAYLGFGHHHVGLTGGPKTGRLLAQMISGRKPNIDVGVYSPSRFKR